MEPQSVPVATENLHNQPVVPPSPSVRPHSKLPWILLVVLLLIATGVGGIFLGKQMSQRSTPPTGIVPPLPSPTPDPTVDWKLYADENLLFSIRYPPTTNEKIPFKQYLDDDLSMGYRLTLTESYAKPKEYFVMIIRKTDPGVDLEKQWDTIKKKENLQTEVPFLIDKMHIDGKEALQVKDPESSANHVVANRILIQANDNYFIEIQKGSSPLTDQILSTFRFTYNQQTTNWKTYTDILYNYSIKYPAEWKIPTNPLQRNGPNGEQLFFIQANAFMNECMSTMRESTITLANQQFKRKDFTGVAVGEMCTDQSNLAKREIWVLSPEENYGMVFTYTTSSQDTSESTFNQILSTFKFTN